MDDQLATFTITAPSLSLSLPAPPTSTSRSNGTWSDSVGHKNNTTLIIGITCPLAALALTLLLLLFLHVRRRRNQSPYQQHIPSDSPSHKHSPFKRLTFSSTNQTSRKGYWPFTNSSSSSPPSTSVTPQLSPKLFIGSSPSASPSQEKVKDDSFSSILSSVSLSRPPPSRYSDYFYPQLGSPKKQSAPSLQSGLSSPSGVYHASGTSLYTAAAPSSILVTTDVQIYNPPPSGVRTNFNT